MSTTFNVGDRVRLTGEHWDELEGETNVGEEVVITALATPPGMSPRTCPAFEGRNGETYYIYVEPDGDFSAELVEPAEGVLSLAEIARRFKDADRPGYFALPLAEHAAPDPTEYRDPRYEGALRQINDLQAVLRKRNEQIVAQREVIATQRRQLTEYAAKLEAIKAALREEA